jgi:hypothetical protein
MLILLPAKTNGSVRYAPSRDDAYNDDIAIPLYGVGYVPRFTSTGNYFCVTKFDREVSWYYRDDYSSPPSYQRNSSGVEYEYIAFLGEENGDGTDYINTALDDILAIQDDLIGGDGK